MILKFLGRGSAFNVKEGNTCAYFKNDKTLCLLDCGESVFERIINKKILDGVENVEVIITHLDSDHVGSLSSLIHYCHYIKNIIIKVFFPNQKLKQMLEIQGHIDRVDYNFYFLEIDSNTFLNSCTVRPISVKHIETLDCFGYLISMNNTLLWYSGDCSEVSNVINDYNIDEFYQDTCLADYKGNVHTSLRLLCETIPKEKRNKVYCMHIDNDLLIEKAKKEGFNVVDIFNEGRLM